MEFKEFMSAWLAESVRISEHGAQSIEEEWFVATTLEFERARASNSATEKHHDYCHFILKLLEMYVSGDKAGAVASFLTKLTEFESHLPSS